MNYTTRVFSPTDYTPEWDQFIKIPTRNNNIIDFDVKSVLVQNVSDEVEFDRIKTTEHLPLIRYNMNNVPFVVGEYHYYTLIMKTLHTNKTIKDILLFRIRVDEITADNGEVAAYSRFVSISDTEALLLGFNCF